MNEIRRTAAKPTGLAAGRSFSVNSKKETKKKTLTTGVRRVDGPFPGLRHLLMAKVVDFNKENGVIANLITRSQ